MRRSFCGTMIRGRQQLVMILQQGKRCRQQQQQSIVYTTSTGRPNAIRRVLSSSRAQSGIATTTLTTADPAAAYHQAFSSGSCDRRPFSATTADSRWNEDKNDEGENDDDDDQDLPPEDDDDDDDDDYDDNNDFAAMQQPWKELLEIPGRSAWRVSSATPEHVLTAMYTVLEEGDRTPKQLRRAHRKVLAMHDSLAERREKERRLMVNGSGSRSYGRRRSTPGVYTTMGDDDDGPAPSQKPGGFVAENNDSASSNNPVYYGLDETLATLKHRLTPNYAITKRVLSECQSLLGGPTHSSWCPTRIVDFGMGCGSASAAAIDLFRDNNKSKNQTAVEWIHGIEPSVPMRECSERLLQELERNKTAGTGAAPRITFGNSISPPADFTPADEGNAGKDAHGTFDLALLVYTATDLTDVTSTLTAAALLFEKLKPNGVLIMIEPGTPDGFNSVRAVRNMLLDCCPPNDDDFEWEERCHIIAPCTHNGSCPMERHKRDFVKQRGKLGHDLPQEEQVEDYTASSDESDSSFDDENHDDTSEENESLESKLSSETEAFNSSFCSFVHHVPGDTTRKGEKFSYLVAQKQRHTKPIEDDDATNGRDLFAHYSLSDTLAEAFEAASTEDDDRSMEIFRRAQEMRLLYLESEEDELGLEMIRGASKREAMGRIIRAPIKKKGHVYIDHCTSPGKIVRSRVTKATSNNIAPGVFGAARKSRWGGLWPAMRKTSKGQ